MNNRFFERPILNSPYEYPIRYWELDEHGQPTQQIIETRRKAEFITPIPRPRKRTGKATQAELTFDEGKGLSTEKQQYDPTSPAINELRGGYLCRNRQDLCGGNARVCRSALRPDGHRSRGFGS